MKDNDSRLNALHRRYRDSLPAKRAEIEAAWQAVCADGDAIDNQKILAALVHRLAGSAESYGHIEIGKAAAVVDYLMDQKRHSENPADQERSAQDRFESLRAAIKKLDDAFHSMAGEFPG